MLILGNIFCFVALIFACISFFVKNRTMFLFAQTLCHIFYITGYCVLEAWTGACVLALINIFIVIFYFYEKHNQKPSWWWLVAVELMIVALTCLTWDGGWSLLLTFANLIFMFGVFQSKQNIFLLCQLLTSALTIIYNAVYCAYSGIALEVIALIVALVALIKQKTTYNNQKL